MRLCAAGLLGFAMLVSGMALAADGEFPFESELLLDGSPMKGSKQVPSLDIDARGQASIMLWCDTVTGQFVVAANTVTIITGPKTARTCPPERMRGDDEMLAALTRVTTWKREGSVIAFQGEGLDKPLRFRLPTN